MKDCICILSVVMLMLGCTGRRSAQDIAPDVTQNEVVMDSAWAGTPGHGAQEMLENDSMPPPPDSGHFDGPPPPDSGRFDGPPPPDSEDFDGPPPRGDKRFGGPPPREDGHDGPPPGDDGHFGGPPPHEGGPDNMRDFDPPSEDDRDNNGMSHNI